MRRRAEYEDHDSADDQAVSKCNRLRFFLLSARNQRIFMEAETPENEVTETTTTSPGKSDSSQKMEGVFLALIYIPVFILILYCICVHFFPSIGNKSISNIILSILLLPFVIFFIFGSSISSDYHNSVPGIPEKNAEENMGCNEEVVLAWGFAAIFISGAAWLHWGFSMWFLTIIIPIIMIIIFFINAIIYNLSMNIFSWLHQKNIQE